MNEVRRIWLPNEWPETLGAFSIDGFLDMVSVKAGIDRSALVPDATMDSLNIPSLDMVDILFGVEEEYDIYIPMGDELSNIVYLRDFVQVILDQVREGPTEQLPAT